MANMLQNEAITRDVASFVGMALFVFYGAGQLISGYLGDRLPAKHLMFSGLMMSAICNLLLPVVPNEYLMIPIWAVNGFAQALLWPPIVRILSDSLSHEKYVTANLVVTCGAHISTIVLYVYAPLCISVFSWRAVFFTSSVFCLVVGVIFIVAMTLVLTRPEKNTENAVEENQKQSTEKASVWQIFHSSGVFPVLVCIIAMGFMRDGIESWLPTLYSEAFNRDSSESILVSVALPVFSIISLFAVRAIHKKRVFNNEVRGAGVLFLISAVLCVPLCLFMQVDGTVYRVICLLLSAVVCACMHSCNFLVISCLPGRFAKTGRASTVGGFCNACTYIGASISMYGIAVISELFGWSATVLLWIGVLLLGFAFALIALKKYTSFLENK